MQFCAAFPQIHDLVRILSLAMSHIPGTEEEGLFGRGEEEGKDGRVEGLLRLVFSCYSPKFNPSLLSQLFTQTVANQHDNYVNFCRYLQEISFVLFISV